MAFLKYCVSITYFYNLSGSGAGALAAAAASFLWHPFNIMLGIILIAMVPALVMAFQVPVQKGIFFNGGSMSPITPFNGDRNDIRYLQYLAPYLPFYVMEKNNRNHVLIIGSGGGESILKSILSGFKIIDALEVDPRVISLMKNQFKPYSGHIYALENVTIQTREARSFIKQTPKKYDLIELSMIDAYNTAASGVYALNESYLYTIESNKRVCRTFK